MTESSGRGPAWLAPQVLLVGLLVLAALVYALRSPPSPAPPPAVALQPDASEPADPVEMELVLAEPGGLERVLFVEARLAEDDAGRIEGVFAALRAELVEAGVWPEEVPPARVFLQQAAGGEVAVLDLQVPTGVTLDVEAELRLVQSIEGTGARHGVRVRYLVNGGPTATLLGHVAVPSALTSD